jgi:hypothetical protein
MSSFLLFTIIGAFSEDGGVGAGALTGAVEETDCTEEILLKILSSSRRSTDQSSSSTFFFGLPGKSL